MHSSRFAKCLDCSPYEQNQESPGGRIVLSGWRKAGLNVETAVKRGIYTVLQSLVAQRVGRLTDADLRELEEALRLWLGL
jgi:mRNA interferase MazF